MSIELHPWHFCNCHLQDCALSNKSYTCVLCLILLSPKENMTWLWFWDAYYLQPRLTVDENRWVKLLPSDAQFNWFRHVASRHVTPMGLVSPIQKPSLMTLSEVVIGISTTCKIRQVCLQLALVIFNDRIVSGCLILCKSCIILVANL